MSSAPAVARSPDHTHAPRVLPARTEDVGRVAASIVAAFVRAHPRGVLGVATGGSPTALYEAVTAMRAEGLVDTRGITLAALDEYVGLQPSDARSYFSYVNERIAAPWAIPAERVHVPAGSTSQDADAYERLLAGLGVEGLAVEGRSVEGRGVDLQIVGIGRNGHIGFNEPGSARDSRTRIVKLDDDTRRANATYFSGDFAAVPTHAMTQGIATILSARSILLLAQGAAKAQALRAAFEGPITPAVPASFLQLHADVTVIADACALGNANDSFEANDSFGAKR